MSMCPTGRAVILTRGVCGEISQLSEVKQLVSEQPTERRRLVAAFWAVYCKN